MAREATSEAAPVQSAVAEAPEQDLIDESITLPSVAQAKPTMHQSGPEGAACLVLGENFGSPEHKQANALLEKMIQAMKLPFDEIAVLGLLHFDSDLRAGSELLRDTLASYSPRVIIAFGDLAASLLLQKKEALAEMRGQLYTFGALKLVPTWHPSDLIETPTLKRESWEDLKRAGKELGLAL